LCELKVAEYERVVLILTRTRVPVFISICGPIGSSCLKNKTTVKQKIRKIKDRWRWFGHNTVWVRSCIIWRWMEQMSKEELAEWC